MYKTRPPRAKYSSTWNPDVVLNLCSTVYFPLSSLSLRELTERTLELLALVTAHRSQTFSKINIDDINITEDLVEIKIFDQIKTSSAGREQPLLILPFLRDNPEICAASSILEYLERTRAFRKWRSCYLFNTESHIDQFPLRR